MKITVPTDRIIVEDSNQAHDAVIGGIPGARFVKLQQAWTLPASPFSAIRLYQWARDNHVPMDSDKAFGDLVEEFRSIKEDLIWKKEESREVWAKIIKESPDWIPTKTTPWIHQGCAFSFIEGKKAAYLALEMGTGKTLVTIMLVLANRLKNVLIVCPKSVLEVWEDELKKHAPGHPYAVLTLNKGNSRQKAETVVFQMNCSNIASRGQIVIVNYDTARQEAMQHVLLNTRWSLVVLDEAHKIKKPGGVTSKFCAKLGKKADIRLCLSGTPLPNNLLDAYAQCRFLDPGLFGTNISKMRAQYCMMGVGERFDRKKMQTVEYPEILEFVNVEKFERLFGYITFRVDKSVLDLPPMTTMNRYCELSKDAQEMYKTLKKEFVAQVESGEVTTSNALVKLMKFQQLTSGFIIDDEGETHEIKAGKALTKEKLLQETFEGIDPSEKIVVFCKFKHDLAVVERISHSMDRRYGELSGTTSDIEGGQFPPDKDILGVQIQAGGIGVNLVLARYAIFFSTGYSLSDYLQATARVHRGGQDRAVTLIHLICKDSVDEKIYQAIEDKKKVVDAILDAIKRGEDI